MLARLTLPRLGTALALTAAAACGSGATSDVNVATTPYVITIVNDTFSPAELQAPPGATILVRNDDGSDHWLQSAAAPGQYVYAAVGGVSIYLRVPPRAEQAFALPADVAVGTVVPFFCADMGSAMVNQGSITIVAPTTASAPSGTAPAR